MNICLHHNPFCEFGLSVFSRGADVTDVDCVTGSSAELEHTSDWLGVFRGCAFASFTVTWTCSVRKGIR